MLRVFSFSQAFYSGRGKLSINTAWESWLTLPLGRDEKENHSKPQSVFSIAVDLQFDSVVSGAKDGEGDRRGQGGADLQPRIARGNRGKGVAWRVIHAVDSTITKWSTPAWTGPNTGGARWLPFALGPSQFSAPLRHY